MAASRAPTVMNSAPTGWTVRLAQVSETPTTVGATYKPDNRPGCSTNRLPGHRGVCRRRAVLALFAILLLAILGGGFAIAFFIFDFIYPAFAAYHEGKVWFVESRILGVGTFLVQLGKSTIYHIDLSTPGNARTRVAEVHADGTFLPGSGVLWFVSEKEVGTYRDGMFDSSLVDPSLPKGTRPFLAAGKPAMIVCGQGGFRLNAFSAGRWRDEGPLDFPMLGSCDPKWLWEDVVIRNDGDRLHVFVPTRNGIHYMEGLPLPLPPQNTPERGWFHQDIGTTFRDAVVVGGEPILITRKQGEQNVVAMRRTGGRWEACFQIPTEFPAGNAYLSTSVDGEIIVFEPHPRVVHLIAVSVKDGHVLWERSSNR